MNINNIRLALKDPKLGNGLLVPCLTAGYSRGSYQAQLSDSTGRTESALSNNLAETLQRVFATFEITL
mgnify:CR=1 FL=1